VTEISDNQLAIFSGHNNGEVFKYNKDGYKSDLFVTFSHKISKIEVSEYTNHVVIKNRYKAELFDFDKNKVSDNFYNFDFTEEYLFATDSVGKDLFIINLKT
jgi:hypothetical protein